MVETNWFNDQITKCYFFILNCCFFPSTIFRLLRIIWRALLFLLCKWELLISLSAHQLKLIHWYWLGCLSKMHHFFRGFQAMFGYTWFPKTYLQVAFSLNIVFSQKHHILQAFLDKNFTNHVKHSLQLYQPYIDHISLKKFECLSR